MSSSRRCESWRAPVRERVSGGRGHSPVWEDAADSVSTSFSARSAVGGMGIVFEAEQETLGRRVALKVLSDGMLASDERLRRFRLEARVAARLHHTNIVPVFGVGEEEGVHYYAMQFIHGFSLSQVLEELRRLKARRGANPPAEAAGTEAAEAAGTEAVEAVEAVAAGDSEESSLGSISRVVAGGVYSPPSEESVAGVSLVSTDSATDGPPTGGGSRVASDTTAREPYSQNVARIGLQVAEALAYAHGEGILHRDVKPGNLILDGRGTVWVTDFGLAKAEDSSDLTVPGGFVGTARYVAPERLRGEGDVRSDVYSLGVTLYELATLRAPFEAADRAQVLEAVARKEPAPPRSVDRSIPRDLETIILKAMAKEPPARYRTSHDLADDLRRFLNYEPVTARRAPPWKRAYRWCQRNPAVASLCVTVAVLVVALAVVGTATAWRLKREKDRVFAQLVTSKLQEARAWRRSDRPGRRLRSLDAARVAARGAEPLAVRNEMIGALALWDVELEASADLPDGRMSWFDGRLEYRARVTRDGAVEVFEPGGGEHAAMVLPARGTLAASLWSPSSRWLAIVHGGEEASLKVWDLESKRAVLEFPRPRQGLPVSFHPRETQLAVGRNDGAIEVRSLPALEQVAVLRPVGPAARLAFDPSGERLAVVEAGYGPLAVPIVDVGTGEVLARLLHPARVGMVAWHPRGGMLAAACFDHRVHLWDTREFRHLRTLEGHVAEVTRVVFDHQGDLLASTGWDNRTILWRPQTGDRLVTLFGSFLQFSRDDRTFGVKKGTRAEEIWRLHGGEEYRRLSVPMLEAKGPFDVEVSPDGRWIATVAGRGGVRLWSLEDPQVSASVRCGYVRSVTFEPNGRRLWGGGDALIALPLERISDDGDWKIGPPEHPGIDGRSIGFDRDGRIAAVLTKVGVVDVYEMPDLTTVRRRFTQPGLAWFNVSPTARWLVTGTWQGRNLVVWDLKNGELLKELETFTAAGRFSPDERWLVVSTGPRYHIVRSGSWEVVHTIPRPGAYELRGTIGFTSDSELVGIAVSQNRIDLYRLKSGEEVARLEPPDDSFDVTSVAFDPSCRFAVVSTVRKVLDVWKLGRIRENLGSLGLDWDPPSRAPSSPATEVRSLRVDYGEDNAAVRAQKLSAYAQDLARVGALSDLLRVEPDAEIFLRRAKSHERMGSPDNARADYDAAVSAAPEDVTVIVARAAFRERRGELEAALADLEEAVKMTRREEPVDAARFAELLERCATIRGRLDRPATVGGEEDQKAGVPSEKGSSSPSGPASEQPSAEAVDDEPRQ